MVCLGLVFGENGTDRPFKELKNMSICWNVSCWWYNLA